MSWVKNQKRESWYNMLFWSEQLLDDWQWSPLYYFAEGLDVIAGLTLIVLFVRCFIKKKDDRLSILYLYLFLVNISSYDLTLAWTFPYNLIPFAVSVVMGYWAYCSKKIVAELNEKERKGIVCGYRGVCEKQEENFKKLSPEEQEEWYENYLQTAPPRLTLKSIILINVGAYLFADFFKLIYYFIST